METDQAVEAEAAASEAVEAASVQERCTRQYVQTAARSAKCHSSQLKENLYTAGTATRSTKSSDYSFLIFYFLIFWETFLSMLKFPDLWFFHITRIAP